MRLVLPLGGDERTPICDPLAVPRCWASSLAIIALAAGVSACAGASPQPGAPRAVAPAGTRPTFVVVRDRAAAPITRPAIRWDPIPFGPTREAQMTAYVRRHYGSFLKPTWRLTDPHVIVIHYTDSSYSSAYNTFANDVPDSELHELPATSAHFVIDTTGVIHQLVSLGTMARHTVGLNWTAIGIEHVGYSDGQVLGDRAEIGSSLRLVHWLRCRFHIPVRDVIGHAESLSSPYHHEDVPSLRTQTHGDFIHADMQIYRRRLSALGGC